MPVMWTRGLPIIALLAAALAPASARTAPPPTGLLREVAFDTLPATARNGELLQRLTSPLQAARTIRAMADAKRTLAAFPLDPRLQHFTLYVPAAPPPTAGYALLVFVPPWKAARVPTEWIPALDRTHTIFVTAANAGNDANVIERREPLALIAAAGAMQRYHVDPARVFIGGFSGGSRIALRLALGYPDVFRGALLDAGSDPIGTATVPLPSADLLHRFQQSTRIVFLTGDADFIHQAQQARASESLVHWCAFNVRSITLLHTQHVLADGAAFGQALQWLLQPTTPDAKRLTACRARVDAALHQKLAALHALLDAGKPDRARQRLDKIDSRYGGLAAPASVAAWQALDRAAKGH